MRTDSRSVGVFLIILGFVVATLIAGVWIGQGQGRLAFGIMATIGLFWAGFAAPLSFFATIYPVVALVGGIQLAAEFSLEKAVVLFGAAGLASGVLLRRLQVPRLPFAPMFGAILWLVAYGISLVAFPSEIGRSEVWSFVQKALFGWFVFIALAESNRLRMAIRLSILAIFIASLFTMAGVITQQDLSYIRSSSFARGETFWESMFRGLARGGTGFSATIAACLALMEYRIAISEKKHGLRWILISIWFFVCSMFALRRESLLSIFVIMLAMVIYRPIKKGMAWFWFVLVTLGLVFIVINISPEWQQRLYGETTRAVETGEDSRLNLLQFSWHATIDSPWLGYGPGNYGKTQYQYTGIISRNAVTRAAHNSFAATAVEAGVPALLGLVLLVLGISWPMIRQRHRVQDERLAAYWAFSPMIVIPIFSSLMFGNSINTSNLWFWMGMLLAIHRLVLDEAKAA